MAGYGFADKILCSRQLPLLPHIQIHQPHYGKYNLSSMIAPVFAQGIWHVVKIVMAGYSASCKRTPSTRPQCDNSSFCHGARLARSEPRIESHRDHPLSRQFRGDRGLCYQGNQGSVAVRRFLQLEACHEAQGVGSLVDLL